MSFWNGMKRAFGFSPEEEEEEGEYDSTLPTYAVNKTSDDDTEDNHDEQKPHKVSSPLTSDSATAQSPMSASDATHEKKPDIKVKDDKHGTDLDLPADMFDAVIELFNQQQPDFVKSCLSTDAQRKYIIDSISDSLKARVGTDSSEIEALRKENRRLQLSVDRQKRAMLDRINDLETQVARHNDEKEKIYLRKKLPVDTEQLDKANNRVTELENELKAQESIRQQLETKIKMSDVLINDLRNQGAAARQELERVQEEQNAVMAHIQEQLDGFEQLKARKNAKIAEKEKALAENEAVIAESRQKIADCEKRIADLVAENESLHRTIENNLYNQAHSERDLRDEIKDLRNKLESTRTVAGDSAEEPSSDDRPMKKRGRPKKVRIDNTLDNTDWFESGKKDDPDFGYHEPPRRPVNDNEAQLTLF